MSLGLIIGLYAFAAVVGVFIALAEALLRGVGICPRCFLWYSAVKGSLIRACRRCGDTAEPMRRRKRKKRRKAERPRKARGNYVGGFGS